MQAWSLRVGLLSQPLCLSLGTGTSRVFILNLRHFICKTETVSLASQGCSKDENLAVDKAPNVAPTAGPSLSGLPPFPAHECSLLLSSQLLNPPCPSLPGLQAQPRWLSSALQTHSMFFCFLCTNCLLLAKPCFVVQSQVKFPLLSFLNLLKKSMSPLTPFLPCTLCITAYPCRW